MSKILYVFTWSFLFLNFLYVAQGAKEWLILKSTHFIIYHQHCDNIFVQQVRDEAEYLYKEIAEWLGFSRYEFWLWDRRAKIYIYKDKDLFIENSRLNNWAEGCADFRRRIIYTYEKSPRFLKDILPHEMGHLVFREFAGMGENIPLFLDEGVAMQMESDRETYIKYAKIFMKEGKFKDLKDIFQMKFEDLRSLSEREVSLFYLQSFSIIYFLLSEYDKRKFRLLCNMLKEGMDFKKALGEAYIFFKRWDVFEKSWQEFWMGE